MKMVDEERGGGLQYRNAHRSMPVLNAVTQVPQAVRYFYQRINFQPHQYQGATV